MSDLANRRPQSVAEHAEIDYNAALRHLGLRQDDPKAHALVLVCARYGLDPLLGHVSIYKDKPYIHFSGYLHIANSNSHFQGVETVREWEDERYCYATVRVHRDDRTFPAERTGKSLKNKPKSGGGTYLDEDADAKAFAQATRRALRLAFVIDHPDPVDDHGGEQPAPEPVVEVARMVDGKVVLPPAPKVAGVVLHETSGAGEREPGSMPDADPRDRRHDPAPDPTSEAGEADERPARAARTPAGLVAERPASASTSGPWGLSPRAHGPDLTSGEGASPAGARGPAPASTPDLTSPPLSADTGKGSRGGDINPPEPSLEDGDALPDDDNVGGSVVDIGGQPDDAVAKRSADPTPTSDPSLIQLWCDEHHIDIRIARVAIRRRHKGAYSDVQDWRDFAELRGEREAKAIKHLDEWVAAEVEEEGK